MSTELTKNQYQIGDKIDVLTAAGWREATVCDAYADRIVATEGHDTREKIGSLWYLNEVRPTKALHEIECEECKTQNSLQKFFFKDVFFFCKNCQHCNVVDKRTQKIYNRNNT